MKNCFILQRCQESSSEYFPIFVFCKANLNLVLLIKVLLIKEKACMDVFGQDQSAYCVLSIQGSQINMKVNKEIIEMHPYLPWWCVYLSVGLQIKRNTVQIEKKKLKNSWLISNSSTPHTHPWRILEGTRTYSDTFPFARWKMPTKAKQVIRKFTGWY